MTQRADMRRARVAKAIRDNLAAMIQRDVKDPRVSSAGLVTIQRVELNTDMSVASVYVSFLDCGHSAAEAALAGLAAAAAFLRGPLARRLRLARAPDLRFMHDTSADFITRLEAIVAGDERCASGKENEDIGREAKE